MSGVHTPGPWDTNVARLSDGSINVAHVVATDRASVAQISIYGEEETVANARLIAASPELYSACAEWIAWLDGDGWRDDAADYELKMLGAMRDALVKARGNHA